MEGDNECSAALSCASSFGKALRRQGIFGDRLYWEKRTAAKAEQGNEWLCMCFASTTS
jgi:hypothetical protein